MARRNSVWRLYLSSAALRHALAKWDDLAHSAYALPEVGSPAARSQHLVEHLRNASKTSAEIFMEETYSLRLNRHLELGKTSRRTARVSVKTVSLPYGHTQTCQGKFRCRLGGGNQLSQAELETPPFYGHHRAGSRLGSGVPNGVPQLPNEVTLGEFWCVSATVSDWDCVASHRRRELLNRCTG